MDVLPEASSRFRISPRARAPADWIGADPGRQHRAVPVRMHSCRPFRNQAGSGWSALVRRAGRTLLVLRLQFARAVLGLDAREGLGRAGGANTQRQQGGNGDGAGDLQDGHHALLRVKDLERFLEQRCQIEVAGWNGGWYGEDVFSQSSVQFLDGVYCFCSVGLMQQSPAEEVRPVM